MANIYYLNSHNKDTELQSEVFKNAVKNKLRTFEARGTENFKNIEPEQKKSGSYKKKVYNKDLMFTVCVLSIRPCESFPVEILPH